MHMYMTLDVGFNCRYLVAAQLNRKVYTDAVEQMVRKVFRYDELSGFS
jgi:predicted small metal-binding protein